MKEPKLSKESARAFVARFAANVKSRLESQDMSMATLGKILNPDAHNPTSKVYFMLRAAKLPSDEVMEQVAKALNCTVEALHHGELEDFKETRGHGDAGRTGDAGKRRRGDAGTRNPRPRPTKVDVVDPMMDRRMAPAEADELYGFVLDAVCACAAHLAEPRKGQYVRELARTCRKYQAGQ